MFQGRGRLGDTTPTPPGFTQNFLTGAEVGHSPSAGITATEGVFTNFSGAFSSANMEPDAGDSCGAL